MPAPTVIPYHPLQGNEARKLARQTLRDFIARGEIPSLQTLIERIYVESFTAFNIEPSTRQSIQDWFHQTRSGLIDLPELTERETREVIWHGPDLVQIDDLSGTRFHSRENPLSIEDFQTSLEILAMENQIEWNYSKPFASFLLRKDDLFLRTTLIHACLSPQGTPKVFFRHIRFEALPLNAFTAENKVISLLKEMVQGKANILISGSTGSGKTSLMNAMSTFIGQEEHVIILEDTHEIHSTLPTRTNLVAKDLPHKSLLDYCAYALRMRPDRILLGEMRSGEVVPFLLAMNTGHRGLMSTIHANDARDALSRVALLFSVYAGRQDMGHQLVLNLIAKNIDYVVHLQGRSIHSIAKVLGSEGPNCFIETVYEASSVEKGVQGS